MKLLIDRLSETPQDLQFEAEPELWARLRDDVPELAPDRRGDFRVQLTAYRAGSEIILQGTLAATLELECGRCLARYRPALREAFRLVLEPAGDRAPADPEAAGALARDGLCLGDELETGWVQGPEADLRAFVTEVVQLALPVQPLCREDCRGLCPRCGVDRNVESCSCDETGPRSPFAVLESLRGRPREGEG